MSKFDPTEVNTVLDGNVVTGFGEDTMIEAERLEDKREVHVGAQGETTIMVNANDVADVTLTLKGTSPTNKTLLELYKQEDPFNLSCSDENTGTGFSGSECYVRNLATFEKGGDLEEREWTIIVTDYEELSQ